MVLGPVTASATLRAAVSYLVLTSELANKFGRLFDDSLQHRLHRGRLVEVCDRLHEPTKVPRLPITYKYNAHTTTSLPNSFKRDQCLM